MSNTAKNGWMMILIAFIFTIMIMNSGFALGDQFSTIKDALCSSKETYKPLVIVLSGDNCSWCTKQKRELKGVKDFNYVVVDAKKHPKLMDKKSSCIPQLVILTHYKDTLWKRKTFVGYKNKDQIRKIIKWQQNLK